MTEEREQKVEEWRKYWKERSDEKVRENKIFWEDEESRERFKEIFELFDKADGNETREIVDNIKSEVNKLDKNDFKEEIHKFKSRIKILENRLNRRVSDDFGSILKHFREKKGLSLAELGSMTGVSASYISRIEGGRRRTPSYPIVERLAEALGIPITHLIDVASSDKGEAKSLSEVLYGNRVKLSGDILSAKEKEKLLEIIKYISEMEWDDNKHIEVLELIPLLDEFK